MLQPTRAKVQRHIVDVTTDERPNIPKENRHPRFVYIHYPQGWEYVAEINPATGEAWGFLPKLKKIVAKAGANGVRNVNGRLDLTGAIQGHAAQGGMLINPADQRLPKECQHYVGYIETVGGGKSFTEPGEEVTVLPNGRALHNRDEAVNLFRAFRLGVRDSGVLSPMIPEVKAMLLNNCSERMNLIGARMHNNPHLKQRYEQWAAIRDGINADWDDYALSAGITMAPAATPRKRTRRKTAPTPEAS